MPHSRDHRRRVPDTEQGPTFSGVSRSKSKRPQSYCIIGPNGAGKSTLLKVIAGLLPPRSGDVVFRGESLAHRRPDQVLATGVCFVPQDQALFPEMSVRENLIMGAYLVKDRAVIKERLARVYEMFPDPFGASRPGRRQDVGRSAADAGHGPRPHDRSHLAHARRTNPRFGPPDCPADLLAGRAAEEHGPHRGDR